MSWLGSQQQQMKTISRKFTNCILYKLSKILIKKVGISMQKSMQCFLSTDHKENCVEISNKLFVTANYEENFLKNIVPPDKTWFYCYVKTIQWSQKRRKREHTWIEKLRGCVLRCLWFYDWKSIFHYDFIYNEHILCARHRACPILLLISHI